MVAFDWGTLIDAVQTAIGAVINAIIAALTTNATLIGTFLVGGVIAGAAVKYSGVLLKKFRSLTKSLF